jgi:hypothetical protein
MVETAANPTNLASADAVTTGEKNTTRNIGNHPIRGTLHSGDNHKTTAAAARTEIFVSSFVLFITPHDCSSTPPQALAAIYANTVLK